MKETKKKKKKKREKENKIKTKSNNDQVQLLWILLHEISKTFTKPHLLKLTLRKKNLVSRATVCTKHRACHNLHGMNGNPPALNVCEAL